MAVSLFSYVFSQTASTTHYIYHIGIQHSLAQYIRGTLTCIGPKTTNMVRQEDYDYDQDYHYLLRHGPLPRPAPANGSYHTTHGEPPRHYSPYTHSSHGSTTQDYQRIRQPDHSQTSPSNTYNQASAGYKQISTQNYSSNPTPRYPAPTYLDHTKPTRLSPSRRIENITPAELARLPSSPYPGWQENLDILERRKEEEEKKRLAANAFSNLNAGLPFGLEQYCDQHQRQERPRQQAFRQHSVPGPAIKSERDSPRESKPLALTGSAREKAAWKQWASGEEEGDYRLLQRRDIQTGLKSQQEKYGR